jgi:hypothetical protein
MQNVANDRDPQVGKFLFGLPYRKHIQHRLGWVGMSTIPGIDDPDMIRQMTRYQVSCAAGMIPDYE